MCQSDIAIVWIILEQDCTHIAFDATYGFKGQTDLHCKGVRTQSLVELRGSWEWVWLSQRSPWSSALCYFCENTERDERKHEEDCKKQKGVRSEEVTTFKEAATFPYDKYSMRHFTLCCGKCACKFSHRVYSFLTLFVSPDICFKITTFQEKEKSEKDRKQTEQKWPTFLLSPKDISIHLDNYSERL